MDNQFCRIQFWVNKWHMASSVTNLMMVIAAQAAQHVTGPGQLQTPWLALQREQHVDVCKSLTKQNAMGTVNFQQPRLKPHAFVMGEEIAKFLSGIAR